MLEELQVLWRNLGFSQHPRSVPWADGRESGYWRTGGALGLSCHHGNQELLYSSALYNVRAQDACRALRIPQYFGHKGSGQSASYRYSSVAKVICRRKKTPLESSAGSSIAWVAQNTREAVNMSFKSNTSTGVRAQSLSFPTSRRVQPQCMKCVKQSRAFGEDELNGQRVVGGGHFLLRGTAWS